MAETKKKVNTTKTMKQPVTSASLDKQIKEAATKLKDSKKTKVFIPKYLVKRLGQNVPIAINGAVVHVPVGEEVEIPDSMAKVLKRSLDNLKI